MQGEEKRRRKEGKVELVRRVGHKHTHLIVMDGEVLLWEFERKFL
jgi:hypothetical protein